MGGNSLSWGRERGFGDDDGALGVIGTGRIAQTVAAELTDVDEGVVVAVDSRTRDAADAHGRRFGVVGCSEGYAALGEDSEVDRVDVATPRPFHHDHPPLAPSRGKPVVGETTFTMTVAEARAVVALVVSF